MVGLFAAAMFSIMQVSDHASWSRKVGPPDLTGLMPGKGVDLQKLQTWSLLMDDALTLVAVPRAQWETRRENLLEKGRLLVPEDPRDDDFIDLIKTLLTRCALSSRSQEIELGWAGEEFRHVLEESQCRLQGPCDPPEKQAILHSMQQVRALALHLGVDLKQRKNAYGFSRGDHGDHRMETILEKAFLRLLYVHGKEKFQELTVWSQIDVSIASPEIAKEYETVLKDLPEYSPKLVEVIQLEGTRRVLEKARRLGNLQEASELELLYLQRFIKALSYYPTSQDALEKYGNSLPYIRSHRETICVGNALLTSYLLDLLAISHEAFCTEGHIAIIATLANGREVYCDASKLREPVEVGDFPRHPEGDFERIEGLSGYGVKEVGLKFPATDALIAAMYGNMAYHRAAQGSMTQVYPAYEEALRWNPKDVTAILGQGICRLRDQDFKAAFALFERARQIDPTDTNVAQNRYKALVAME